MKISGVYIFFTIPKKLQVKSRSGCVSKIFFVVFFSSLTSFFNCFYNHHLQNPFKTNPEERKNSSVLQFFK